MTGKVALEHAYAASRGPIRDPLDYAPGVIGAFGLDGQAYRVQRVGPKSLAALAVAFDAEPTTNRMLAFVGRTFVLESARRLDERIMDPLDVLAVSDVRHAIVTHVVGLITDHTRTARRGKIKEFRTDNLDPRRMFSDADYRAIAERDGNVCARADCGELRRLQVDHVIPHSLGGRTDVMNGQLLCPAHNASKGNRFVG